MAILNFQCDSSEMMYLETTDSFETVTTPGYLSELVAQGAPLSETQMALVSTCENGDIKFTKVAFYDVLLFNNKWSLVPC